MRSKNNIIVALLLAAFLPVTASAAITYSRSPSGSGDVEAPITITWSFDDITDFGAEHTGNTVYYITLDDDFNPVYPSAGNCYNATTEKSGSIQIDAPDVSFPDPVKGVMLISFPAICESGDTPYYFEGTGASTIFTIIEAAAGFSVISGAAASSFLSGASDAVKTTGLNLWAIVAVALGIPLALFTIHAVLALFPRRKR